jgi:hypothetical protein
MERLAIVTVAAGLRTVAGVGFYDHKDVRAQSTLKQLLEGDGLYALVTAPDSGSLESLLWLFSDPSKVDEIRKVASVEEAGLLLGYPACCVKRQHSLVDKFGDSNVWPTVQAYPFVFHTACDECLMQPNSATAVINRTLKLLAQQVDRSLFQAISDMAPVSIEISRIISDAEAKGLSRGTLDRQTDKRIQALFREQEKIHARVIS